LFCHHYLVEFLLFRPVNYQRCGHDHHPVHCYIQQMPPLRATYWCHPSLPAASLNQSELLNIHSAVISKRRFGCNLDFMVFFCTFMYYACGFIVFILYETYLFQLWKLNC
jgi:hypothetical protein